MRGHHIPHSEETKKRMSLSKIRAGIVPPSRKGCIPWNKGIKDLSITGEKHPMWKGDAVQYSGVHIWVTKTLGRPQYCVGKKCKGISKKYEWANKTGKYQRDIKDWIRLCKSCHTLYDIKRLKKRLKYHAIKNKLHRR